MKRILLLFLPFLPYLATAQVAKDTVTVLTLAQIPAGAIRDTTNLTFVQDNAFAKANFDSLAKYTRVKLQTYTLDSTHIAASGLNLQGTRFTGVLPVTRGGTGNTTGLAATATELATARTIQTNLASTSAASFNGTANITPGVTGQLPVGNGGTGTGTQFTAGSIVFAGAGGVYSQNNSKLFWDNSNNRFGVGTATPIGSFHIVTSGTEFTPTSTASIGGSYTTRSHFLGTEPGIMLSSDINPVGAAQTGAQTFQLGLQIAYYGNNDVRNQIYFGNAPLTFIYSGDQGVSFSERMRIDKSGNVGIGVASPSSTLHLKAGTASANTSPLKFTSGTNLTTPEAGAMEFNGTNLFFTPSTTRHTVNHGLAGSATLDFASTNAQNSQDLTITVTGASDGDVVSLGVPNGSVNANTCFTAWVSATNTVTVRFNNYSSGAVDPASGVFKVFVTK